MSLRLLYIYILNHCILISRFVFSATFVACFASLVYSSLLLILSYFVFRISLMLSLEMNWPLNNVYFILFIALITIKWHDYTVRSALKRYPNAWCFAQCFKFHKYHSIHFVTRVLQGCYTGTREIHDDVIKWKHFPRYWPFVRGIHRSPVNAPHKGQWREALMFTLICVWINGSVNNGEASD